MLIPYIYPNFYSLHNMSPEVSHGHVFIFEWVTTLTCFLFFQCGTMGEAGLIMPIPLPLSSERLERHGLYLIEDGQTMFLWIGRDAVPQLVMDVFDLPSYEQLRGGKVRVLCLPVR